MKYLTCRRLFVLCSTLAAWTLPTRVDAQANMAVAPESLTGDALAGAAAAAADAPVPRKKKKKNAPPKAAPSAEPPPPEAAADDAPAPRSNKKTTPEASDETPAEAALPRKASQASRASVDAAHPAGDAPAPVAPRKKSKATSSVASDAVDESVTDTAPAAPRKKPHSHTSRSAHASKVHRDREPDAEYIRLRESWHAPIAAPVQPAALLDEQGRPPLVIAPVNGGESVTLTPDRDDGGFDARDLALAARVFTPKVTQKPHAVAPHLLDLIYQAMRHFGAPLVHLISGYRHDRPGSRHTQGRAIDMVIPGVTNDELVEYVRKFGFCGVGIYPKSGFVHLDVRESSFFWLDETLPDERSKGVPILSQEADAVDCAARDRGEAPQTFVPNNEREDRAAARAYEKRARKRAQAQHASAE
jgi:uncharacterized protein YcbK (DUF882 family)